MKLRAFDFLIVAIVATCFSDAFRVVPDHHPAKPIVDNKNQRRTHKVEKYTDRDRKMFFPDEKKIRHGQGQAPSLTTEERHKISKLNKNYVLSKGATLCQDYPISDRTWGFPDSSKVRCSEQEAPLLERECNKPDPHLLIEE